VRTFVELATLLAASGRNGKSNGNANAG
jgi:hypothetical protein